MSDKKAPMTRQNDPVDLSTEKPAGRGDSVAATIGAGVNGLFPCPFCAGPAEYRNDVGDDDGGFWEWIECGSCGGRAPSAEAWNKRTPIHLEIDAEAASSPPPPNARVMVTFGDNAEGGK